MKKHTVTKLLLSLVVAGSMWACKPRGAEYIDELDLVYTNYDAKVDFKSKNTFSLPDSIVKITGDRLTDTSKSVTFIDNVYAAPILASIRSNMIAKGWVEVKKSENPDVVLLPSVSTTTNIYYYYSYYYYWGWYYPYYPYGGWYYPYYPTAATSYRTGSLFIQMASKEKTPTDQIPVMWTAIFNGMLEGGTSYVTSRVQSSINQAFNQSPYLQQ